MTRPAPPFGPTVDQELCWIVGELDVEERRVLLWISRRLLAGQAAYGSLDLRRDPRDWRNERDEELADALVYSACEALRRDLSRRL